MIENKQILHVADIYILGISEKLLQTIKQTREHRMLETIVSISDLAIYKLE